MASQGVVKFFDDVKGFGFIAPDDGSEELFVHRTGLACDGLVEGDHVSFDASYDDVKGKMRAQNVTGGTGKASFGGKGGGKGGGKSKGPQVCRQFQAGNCSFGDSCRFAHVDGGFGGYDDMGGFGGFGGKKGGGKKGGGKGKFDGSPPVCRQFQAGNCSFGDNCRFQHI
eukprot:TRINITY_DN5440_c0_g1_i1.p1 TRINITY_DN5440_c0_g1~~TRINITY_DN5440_c0_g1_i1.p1  ORF type:complete len:169 (-),score=44.60 TRINITY_DN5440_c0_g1_i1:207-713(-)